MASHLTDGVIHATTRAASLHWCIAQATKTDGALNGDGYLLKRDEDTLLFALADGVGSGQLAHDASSACLRILAASDDMDLPSLFETCHTQLTSTRGAALGLVKFFLGQGFLEWAAVGDIEGCIYPTEPTISRTISMMQRGGTLGHYFTGITPQQHAWPPTSMLALCTDGVSRSFRERHPNDQAPREFADSCFNDFGRDNDDRTLATFSWTQEGT